MIEWLGLGMKVIDIATMASSSSAVLCCFSHSNNNNNTAMSKTELTEVWTADELMGNGAPVVEKSNISTSAERRKSSFRRAGNKDNKQVEPADWGRPGHLTPDEAEVYVRIHTVL